MIQRKLQENNLLRFDPVTHTYTYAGVVWPSVTQLLGLFKLVDFSMVDPVVLEEKRRLGTIVHRGAELLDKQTLDEDHFNLKFPEAVPYLHAYRRFREIEDFEPEDNELRLYSKKWRYAGTLDRQGIFKGLPTIIDLKCSWEIYPSNGPQTAGYALAFEELFGTKIKRRFALQLKPTGHYELKEYKSPQDLQDFLACLVLYWRRREHYKTIDVKEIENGQLVTA